MAPVSRYHQAIATGRRDQDTIDGEKVPAACDADLRRTGTCGHRIHVDRAQMMSDHLESPVPGDLMSGGGAPAR